MSTVPTTSRFDSEGASLHLALRPVLMVLVALAAVSALITCLYKSLHAAADSGIDLGASVQSPMLLVAIAAFLVHATYLSLVVRDFVLLRPFDYAEVHHVALPATLCAAYVASAVDAFTGFRFKEWPFLAFALVYIVWLWLDTRPVRDRTAEGASSRERQRIWITVDVLSASVLLAGFVAKVALHRDALVNASLAGTGVKDWVVAVSVATWAWTAFVLRSSARDNLFLSYQAYLDACRALPPSPSAAAPVAGLGRATRVLDFASADSRRAAESLAAAGLEISSAELIRFDVDRRWESACACDDSIASHRFVRELAEARQEAASCDVVVASHALYDRRLAAEFGSIVEAAPSGAYVVVRGYGPNSFFAAVLMQQALSPILPSPAHLWNASHLERIVRRSGLTNLCGGGTGRIGKPYVPLEQELVVGWRNLDAIHTVLQVLYGLHAAQVIREIVERILAYEPEARLANHDLVYVYRKERGNG